MYTYFSWALIFGLIWLILYICRKDLRYEMFFSSLLFLPFGLTQPLFVPEYWNPIVFFRIFGIFDIESLLWCFFTGGIVAVFYEEIFGLKLRKLRNSRKSRKHAYVIYFLMILMVLSMIFIKYFTVFSVIRYSFIAMIFIFLYFVISRPDLFSKSIFSGFIFMIFYIISLLFVDIIFSGFILNQWTIQGSIGIKLFYIVIEEYIYAFLFGVVWSVVYEEINNIKLNKIN
jgi:hypothetical protein